MTANTDFQTLDFVILIGYFVFMLAFGIWSASKGSNNSVSGFFMGGRNINWFLVGCGLFASNVGSTHFIGLTGSGAKDGIGIAGFELNAMFVLILLGWLFVPVYLAGQVYTMPEYLRKRFGGKRIQIYLSVLALILYVFIRISADLYSGTIFIEHIMHWSTYPAILALLTVSSLFTIHGGLTAVMWTDMIQTILILVGAAVIFILSLIEVGGIKSLTRISPRIEPTNLTFIGYDSNNRSCSKATDYYWNLLRPATDPNLPWTGMTFGLTISAVWGWCSDQVLVQRAVCAKNVTHAKAGCVMAGYLKCLPLFLFVFPGMAARILFPDEMSCSAPEACKRLCGSPYGCNDIAYPLLVAKLMPTGAKGFMMSVMLAAIMSSLSSVFNSSATLFTIDIWTRVRKNASEMELIVVGKLFILLLVAISVAWMPVIKLAQGSQLFHYTQSVISYLAPPICSVYVLAVFWSRTNEKGAFWGLMVGLVVGVARFIMEFSYPAPACASGLVDDRPLILSKVHYLHFGCILFLIVCFVTIVVSLVTPPLETNHTLRLTFWTRHSQEVNDLKLSEVSKQNASKQNASNQNVLNQNVINQNPSTQNPSNQNVSNQDVYGVRFKSKDGEINMEVIESSTTNQGTSVYISRWRRFLYFICGFKIPKTEVFVVDISPEDEVRIASQLLYESKKWKIICNANAIILFCFAVSIHIYYN